MDESPIVMVIIFVFCVMGFFFYNCGKDDVEKQAISRGYATYNECGVFEWKEGQNEIQQENQRISL